MEELKVVAIVHKSAGNETVGEMWRETKIFDLNTPVKDIILWASPDGLECLRSHLEITVAK